MLRLMMGDVADVISHGQRVLPRRTIELGYRFRFPTIAAALADALNKGDKYN
jgi:NAD dependent epimerase/dehydratase family enzyme